MHKTANTHIISKLLTHTHIYTHVHPHTCKNALVAMETLCSFVGSVFWNENKDFLTVITKISFGILEETFCIVM